MLKNFCKFVKIFSFHLGLNGVSMVQTTFMKTGKQFSTYPLQDEVADNVVKQMLNLAPPSDGSYDVECISYQTFQDATITQGANVTFEVNSSTKDDKVRFFELTKNLSKHARLIIV